MQNYEFRMQNNPCINSSAFIKSEFHIQKMRWFFSPIMIALGILIMKYTVAITNNFTGPISFAEQYLRTFGGTYAFWRLFGLGLCLFGLLWLTGVIAFNPSSELQISQLVHYLIQ